MSQPEPAQFFEPQPEEQPTYDHPLSKATMVCMRGPCQHYWSLVTRFKAPGETISKKHSQACIPDPEMDLNEQNVYSCSNWWPAPLSWFPESLRSFFRPALVRLYEKYLIARGYDMSWKDWDDDIFALGDDPEIRKDLKLGARRKDDGEPARVIPDAPSVSEG